METSKKSSLLLFVLVILNVITGGQSPAVITSDFTSSAFLQGSYFHLPPDSEGISKVTVSDYHVGLGRFLSYFYQRVLKESGLSLRLIHDWESPYFGAHASLKDHAAEISLLGGLARAPGASPLVLAAVLCHELGHFIGGEPRQTIVHSEWASAEGQADFYAATTCLPDYLASYPTLVQDVAPEVSALCEGHGSCTAVAQAGLELVRFLQTYSFKEYTPVQIFSSAPAMEQFDVNSYPSDQCRLDFFIQAALCQKEGRSACPPPSCWIGKQ